MDTPNFPLLDSTTILKGLCQLNDYIDQQTPADYWRQGLALFCGGLHADAVSLNLYDMPAGLREAGCTFGRFSVVAAAYLETWEQPSHSAMQSAGANPLPEIERSPVLDDGCTVLHARVYADQREQGALSVVYCADRYLAVPDEPIFGQMARSFVGNGLRAEKMQEADRQLERANLLYQMGQTIAGSLDMAAVLDRTTALATDALNAEAAVLYRVDVSRQELVFVALKGGSAQPVVKPQMPFAHRVAGRVAASGRPLVLNAPLDDEIGGPWRAATNDFAVRHIICIPLYVNDRIVGVLEVLNKSDGSGFTPDDLDLLMTMGQLVGVAIENASLFRQEQQRVQQMRSLYEVSQSIISDLDVSVVLDTITQSVLEISGADRSELFLCQNGRSFYELHASAGLGDNLPPDRTPTPLESGIAGWAISHQAPLTIARADQDERYLARLGLPELDASSVSAWPLTYGGRTLGALVLYSLRGESSDPERKELFQIFTNKAAIALRNADLFKNLRNEQERLLRVQEDVRNQLARDLHDNTAQMLSLIIMNLEMARQALAKQKLEAVAAELDTLEVLARQANQEVRTLLFELRPVVLENQGLIPALQAYHRQLQTSLNCEVHLDIQPLPFELSVHGARTIFDVIQEAVNNIRRHARASNLWIRLHTDALLLTFEVEDDGVGFDFAATIENYYEAGSYGLLNMHERASIVSGSLQILSPRPEANNGVLVRGILPRKQIQKQQSQAVEKGWTS